MLKGVAFKLP